MNFIKLLMLKQFFKIGAIIGLGLGFLYGIGGFVYDYIHTGINTGSYLALNALWAMPLIFGGMGFILGGFVKFLRHLMNL